MARSSSAQRIIELRHLISRLEMFIGFLSLTLAAFLLRLEARRLGHAENTEQVLGFLTAMAVGAMALVMSMGREETPPRPSLPH